MIFRPGPLDLQTLPKVELHRHLECSMRLSTFKELAPQVGIDVPPTDREVKDKFLVTEPMRDLESVLKKFLMTQAVLTSEEILARITYEVIEDAVKEGIRILELRYAPTFVREGHEHLNFEGIHRAIARGMEMAQAKGLPIAVGLICIIQRTMPLDVAERVTDFAIDHKDSFVALDLADNEADFNARPFAPCFSKAKKAGLKITVHAGESPYPEAARAVLDAIEFLGADRIGHGLQIHTNPNAMDVLKRKKIPLELCPTSNWLTNAVPSLAAHPFRKLMEFGVPVTINSDDPGVFDINLVNEYRVLHELHGLDREEFDACNDVAAAASFVPFEKKKKVWPRGINRALAPWN